jgi:hypothetical protein
MYLEEDEMYQPQEKLWFLEPKEIIPWLYPRSIRSHPSTLCC